jgi:hypothetical protein
LIAGGSRRYPLPRRSSGLCTLSVLAIATADLRQIVSLPGYRATTPPAAVTSPQARRTDPLLRPYNPGAPIVAEGIRMIHARVVPNGLHERG